METKQKKAAIDLTDLALGIIILGIVVTVGATILTTTRDSRLTDLPVNTATNEATFINRTTDTLTNSWFKSITACANSTSGQTILSGNYTTSTNAVSGIATLSNASTTEWNAVSCNYTYYDTTQADYALADDAATGIGEFGNWFKIITIVGVAAVVLSLIFMAFGRGRESTSY